MLTVSYVNCLNRQKIFILTETEFLDNVRRRLAIVSVGASTLRNQGAAGIVDKARDYFTDKIKIADFFTVLPDPAAFDNYLDLHTANLVLTFAEGGQSWGAARKGLNLFFREVVYNRFLADHYKLPANFADYNYAIKNLEVPLDKGVGTNIQSQKPYLPIWVSIKLLQKPISDQYQRAAQELADKDNIAKVHLDLKYWRQPLVTTARTATMNLAQIGRTNIG